MAERDAASDYVIEANEMRPVAEVERSAAYVPRDAKVCSPECRNPDYNECADCWKDGGNPALYPRPASDAASTRGLSEEMFVEDPLG